MASEKRTVGAFDVRYFIAIALGLMGIYLLLVSAFADPQLEKTGGVHANLWTGIGMVLVAVVFAVWSRLRPLYVDQKAVDEAHETMSGVNKPDTALAADDDA